MPSRQIIRLLTAALTCAIAAPALGAQQMTPRVVPPSAPVLVARMDAPAPIASLVASASEMPTAAPAAVPAPQRGPQRDAAVAGVRVDARSLELSGAVVAKVPQRTRGTSLMILGGAAFVAGLIIGGGAGTAIAVGGAVVGLYGMYLYLP